MYACKPGMFSWDVGHGSAGAVLELYSHSKFILKLNYNMYTVDQEIFAVKKIMIVHKCESF